MDVELTHSKKYRKTILAWQLANKEHYNAYQCEYRKLMYHMTGYGEVVKKRKRDRYQYEKIAKIFRNILLDENE